MKRTKKDQPFDGGTPVHLCDHQTTVVPTTRGVSVYTTAIDKTGALWERWNTDPPGVWHEIQRPTK